MSTEEQEGPEAPDRLVVRADDDAETADTEGHKFFAKEDEDDTEGHKFTAKTGDPGSQELGLHTAARPDDEDDTEGHVKHGSA